MKRCGAEEIRREAEAGALPFLLKLRLTANVKRMIEKLASSREWVAAGQDFEAKESEYSVIWSPRSEDVEAFSQLYRDLSRAFQAFLNGRLLRAPP
jgi:hypothetical protein